MTESDKLKKCIQQLAGTFNKDIVDLIACTVNSVDEDNFICDCTAISGDSTTKIPGVKLNAEANDGFLMVPSLDSTVMVVASERNGHYVLMYSDIEKVVCIIDSNNKFEFSPNGFVWNGGSNGGLIKIQNLKIQYDANIAAIKNAVASALTVIDTQLVALGQPGGTVTVFNTAAASIANLNLTPLENTKIKH